MFLRKLFKVPDKIKWLALELLVVFVGVYLAFVFQNLAQQTQIDKEQEKVFVSLKKELDQLRMDLPGFADFQTGLSKEWDSLRSIGEVTTFYTWRYIEPQYNFKVIEYAISLEGTDIINFEIYEALLNLYSEIKKLEHTERLMTEYGGKYKNIPNDINQQGEMAKIMRAENRLNFYKFTVFADDREGIMRRVARHASEIVTMINERIGPAKTKAVDLALLKEYVDAGVPIGRIETDFLEYFPQYSEEVLQEEIKRLTEK